MKRIHCLITVFLLMGLWHLLAAQSATLQTGLRAAPQKAEHLALLLKREEEKKEKQKTDTLFEEIESIKSELAQLKQKHKDELAYRTDPSFTFSADLTPALWYGSNLELLNSTNSSDNYGFIQYIFDCGFQNTPSTWDAEFQPLTMKGIIRLRSVMGDRGSYNKTLSTPIKIGTARTDTNHNQHLNKIFLWARELWLKYQMSESDTQKFFQVGLFPFSLGHGFALGDAHSVGEIIPGQFCYQSIDQFRPGVLFSSTTWNKWLQAQLYFGILQSDSDNFDTTSSYTQAQNLEDRSRPERGPWKKNYVMAAEAKFRPYQHTMRRTKVTINPYVLFNNNKEAYVDFPGDATQKLFTTGLFCDFERGNVSCSFEIARNFGEQKVKKWDRNQFLDTSTTFQDHLFFVPAGKAGVTYTDNNFDTNGVTEPSEVNGVTNDGSWEFAEITTVPQDLSLDFANGESFAMEDPANAGEYFFFKNSFSRFRRGYVNTFNGWMIYGDVQYQHKNWKATVAIGAATGDNNPNDNPEKISLTRLTSGAVYKDIDKIYNGFIGVQEMFNNKAIESLFFFETRKMNRPLSYSDRLTQPMFSNLIFFAFNARYQSELKDKKVDAQINIIPFFQYTKTEKEYNYHLTQALDKIHSDVIKADAEKELDYYLGTEINATANFSLSKDVSLFGKIACFIPGQYYEDANNKYIPIATQIKLAGTDFSGIEDDSTRYNIRLGKETAFVLTAGISAEFDSSRLGRRRKRKAKPFAFLTDLFKRKGGLA